MLALADLVAMKDLPLAQERLNEGHE
jgi:hypothetical protein